MAPAGLVGNIFTRNEVYTVTKKQHPFISRFSPKRIRTKARAAGFRPYTDAAGPSAEQAEQNTRALAETAGAELLRLPDPSGFGPDEIWAEKNGRRVIFDRWGFCSGDGRRDLSGAGGLDQASFELAVVYLNS